MKENLNYVRFKTWNMTKYPTLTQNWNSEVVANDAISSPREFSFLFESPIVFSITVLLMLLYITVFNHKYQIREESHMSKEMEEMESEEESKELGLISKKLGVAREVITIIAESFNKAAHDLELVNVVHGIVFDTATPDPPGLVRGNAKERLPNLDNNKAQKLLNKSV